MKSVVVIGGGFAGSVIAKNLKNHFNVTLIDDKDYFEFTPSVLRTLVEPDKIHKIQVLHKSYLKNAEFILSRVTNIDKKFVYTKKGKVKYDYLTICSGSNYSLPIKAHNMIEATRAKNLIDSYKFLIKANNVLIVGGGLVGVELAAEICTHFKEKKITLVSSSKELIKRNNMKSIKYAEDFLIKNKVNIVREERIINHKNNTYFSDKGNEYKADIAYLCTGITPNYEFLKKNFKNCLNDKNTIDVNEFLQVKGQKNIFCAGDVNSVRIEKTAQSAILQAKIIINNIFSLHNKKPLKIYRAEHRGLVISLGKNKGIFETKYFVLTGFIPSIMKKLIEKFEIFKYK